MSFERRQNFRANVAIPIEVSQSGGFCLHATKDISQGGAFFDRAIPEAVGSRVQLAFKLPGDDEAIFCDGEVVNVPNAQGYGMGVQFLVPRRSLNDS